MENKNLEQQLNNEFSDFLKTKGLTAKFKLAFVNMKESAKEQHKKDVAEFNAVKAKSIEASNLTKEVFFAISIASTNVYSFDESKISLTFFKFLLTCLAIIHHLLH